MIKVDKFCALTELEFYWGTQVISNIVKEEETPKSVRELKEEQDATQCF